MGLITHGIPQNIVLDLAKESGCMAFVETGTFQGATTRWAAEHFESVYTVERSDVIFERYSGELSKLPNVRCFHADSRQALPEIMDQLADQSAVFWLDGHWSGHETAGDADECPLVDELAVILSKPNDQHVILIDDARFFLSSPPRPHAPEQWPSIAEIVRCLPDCGGNRVVQVIDDVIFVVPGAPGVQECLTKYAQDVADIHSTRLSSPTISRRLKSMLGFSHV